MQPMGHGLDTPEAFRQGQYLRNPRCTLEGGGDRGGGTYAGNLLETVIREGKQQSHLDWMGRSPHSQALYSKVPPVHIRKLKNQNQKLYF